MFSFLPLSLSVQDTNDRRKFVINVRGQFETSRAKRYQVLPAYGYIYIYIYRVSHKVGAIVEMADVIYVDTGSRLRDIV